MTTDINRSTTGPTHRLVIFKAEDSSVPGWESRTLQPSGSLTDLLGQHFDYSNGPAPEVGYRLPEFKHDDAATTFDHRGGVTHQRLSVWCVSRVDEYVGNIGQEAMDDESPPTVPIFPYQKIKTPG